MLKLYFYINFMLNNEIRNENSIFHYTLNLMLQL